MPRQPGLLQRALHLPAWTLRARLASLLVLASLVPLVVGAYIATSGKTRPSCSTA